MDTERRHLRRVEAGERLPVPADDLEFLDESAAVNAAGLRQELHNPTSDGNEPEVDDSRQLLHQVETPTAGLVGKT